MVADGVSWLRLLLLQVPGAVSPMANPMGMMDMVKGQAYFAITQMGMMQFSEMFFSGFVLSESCLLPGADLWLGCWMLC